MKETGQIQSELRKYEIHQSMSALADVLNKGNHVNFVRDPFHILTLLFTLGMLLLERNQFTIIICLSLFACSVCVREGIRKYKDTFYKS